MVERGFRGGEGVSYFGLGDGQNLGILKHAKRWEKGGGYLRLDYGEGLEAGAPLLFHQVAVVVDIQVRNCWGDLILLVNSHNLQGSCRFSVLTFSSSVICSLSRSDGASDSLN